ncbi:MAG: Nif3-like dinuclear metal center hexameric protein, partial [Sedimentisphaerales bacterium]|nr:Nif3-like dinuclear metal center hexameric protein [Sedimentisphaerales bacterium]
MKVHDVCTVVDELVPLKLAQDWDNVGLLIGRADKDISTILVCIDVTTDVVAEARKKKTDMILSYHPVIWDGLKRITADGPSKAVYELIRSGISVVSIHTAFDVITGGVNDQLADMLGIVDPRPIGDYVQSPQGPLYKLTTFVPKEDVNRVAEMIFAAGAGQIGQYSHCGFRTEGTGSFLPLKGAKPTIGKKGKMEYVDEIRLESIVAADKVPGVIAAMRKAHPYETPAFDVFRHHDLEGKWGLGRMGSLAKPTSIPKIIQKIKQVTGAKAVGMVGSTRRTVKTAAVCAGTCGKIIDTVISAGCDLYVTGELKHHVALAAQEAGLTCICLSHTVSERFALKKLVGQLKKRLKPVTISLSRADADPFT